MGQHQQEKWGVESEWSGKWDSNSEKSGGVKSEWSGNLDRTITKN